MRNGQRVYDADTHGLPPAEILESYLDPKVRDLIPDMDDHLAPMKVSFAGEPLHEPYKHLYRFMSTGGWVRDAVRVLGDAGPKENVQREWQKFGGGRFPTD